MKLLSASVIVTTVALVCWTDSKLDQWEGEQQVMVTTLLTGESQDYTPLQEWDDLPLVAKQYLSHVVPPHHTPSESLVLQQDGSFLMKQDQYVPFTAQQVFATSPPGFFWQGRIALTPSAPQWFPKLVVSDSWVEGKGHFQAAVQAIVPILWLDPLEENNEMTLGQATRWLADAVLLPSTLLPDAGIVTWKPVQGSPEKALLEFQLPIADNIRNLQLEATFDDETGYLVELSGLKPFLRPNSQFEMKTWQVLFEDYQEQDNGMLVPTKMESGWVNDEGNFEAYYKIDNRSLQYHYSDSNTEIS